MKTLKEYIAEASLLDMDGTIADGDDYIKKYKHLDIVKKHFDSNIKISNLKYNRKTDATGKKLEIGDLVMYPRQNGGYDNLYKYELGIIMNIYNTVSGSQVKLNISGDKDKYTTDTVYCINVIKVTPSMVKNLYK